MQVVGHVVDAKGKPVRGIQVTAPLQSKTESQPDFCYHTDQDGRFQTDKLSPGNYLFKVGGIYGPNNQVGFPIADAPGVYASMPLTIRAGEPVAELTLRPAQDIVRCVATLVSTRPLPNADEKQKEPMSLADEKAQKRLAESFFATPSIFVRGLAHNIAWEGQEPSLIGYVSTDGEPPARAQRVHALGIHAPCKCRKVWPT